jgi:hypothetical protein
MRIHVVIALFSVPLLMYIGVWQLATAQPRNTFAIDPRTALTPEQVVNNLVRRNLELSSVPEAPRWWWV